MARQVGRVGRHVGSTQSAQAVGQEMSPAEVQKRKKGIENHLQGVRNGGESRSSVRSDWTGQVA